MCMYVYERIPIAFCERICCTASSFVYVHIMLRVLRVQNPRIPPPPPPPLPHAPKRHDGVRVHVRKYYCAYCVCVLCVSLYFYAGVAATVQTLRNAFTFPCACILAMFACYMLYAIYAIYT